jgi:hypothetical protein
VREGQVIFWPWRAEGLSAQHDDAQDVLDIAREGAEVGETKPIVGDFRATPAAS